MTQRPVGPPDELTAGRHCDPKHGTAQVKTPTNARSSWSQLPTWTHVPASGLSSKFQHMSNMTFKFI